MSAPAPSTCSRWLSVLWALALVCVVARMHLVALSDREGGVFAVGLKRWPSLEYEREEPTEKFRENGDLVLISGNENGARGMDLLRVNARYGWALALGSAVGMTVFCLRGRRRAARP